jgi:hypothetical protein
MSDPLSPLERFLWRVELPAATLFMLATAGISVWIDHAAYVSSS